MIIDFHCHAGVGEGFRGPWESEARLESHLRRARRAGIDRTVVFPVFCEDYPAANERLAPIVAARRAELTGFASVHPVRDAGRIGAMVRRAVEEHGFRGIKVHGHDALPRAEVMEAARRCRVPVLVDVVGRPGVVEEMARRYPEVPVVVAHLGGFGDDWSVQSQVIDLMSRYRSVHADTSGVRYFDQLVSAVRRAGPGKLVFGSDGPLLHPGAELRKVELLGLPAAARRQVLGGNARRLLGLPDSAPVPRKRSSGGPRLVMPR